MSEVKTIEQLARDAGWIETTLFESRDGDQVLILASGGSGIAGRLDGHHVAVTQPDGHFVWELGAEPVLRAPRPEPNYEF